jgi:hypothetical protein
MKKVFLLAAVSLSLTGFAQKVNGNLNFKKGQKLEVVTQVNSVVSMDMMGKSMETKVDLTINRAFDVEDVTNGAAKIEHKVKRLQMNMDIPMMGQQSFDSEKESDMKGEGGKAAEKALKNKYSMMVDTKGNITTVKADDDNPNKNASSTDMDMMSGAFGQGADGMTLPKAGEKVEFKVLPEKEVTKGESWTVDGKDSKSIYTLSDITDNEIIVTFTEEGKTERTQTTQGMEMLIKSTDKTTGKIILDKASGIMKQRTSTTNSEGNMEVMGQSMPMNTKITKTVTVKGI